ncbi:MAG: hypothetical protein H8E57_05165 [Candidatus Cloacimonetes bacterium]|nr:hypothetical protein [Candidatus Cloacimonadota bacterium]
MNYQERHKVIHCFDSGIIAANEDIFNGDPAGDVITMDTFRTCTFTIIKNAGAVGTATITVESCDDTTPSTATAVAFKYRKIQDPDTHGVWTDATAAGFTTAAEADCIYEIQVHSNGLSGTDKYVRMQCTEVENAAVDGAIFAVLTSPRYPSADPDTEGSNVD